MRVILDTNVFISMALGGQVGKINDGWKAGKFTLVVSDDIVSEYLDVLRRPKLHLSSQTVTAIANRIYRKAKFTTPKEKVTVIEADPSDNKFLEAAITGRVDFIVSGDKHLFGLQKFRSIPILTVRDFIAMLERE
jgi:putative PIN family toxin of toxin-antitoxin system